MNLVDLKLIFNTIESGKCLAFLGAGASSSYVQEKKKEEGTPLGKELSKYLANSCNYPLDFPDDLQKVSEYYVFKNGRISLENEIVKKMHIWKPRPIHTVLSQLKQIKFIITTNYDILLENELNKYGRRITTIVHDLRNPKAGHFQGTIFFKEEDIILYKMHGCITNPGSIIITESDYIGYLANLNDIDRGIPEYFLKFVMPQMTFLFLGYSLEDWDLRAIWYNLTKKYSTQRNAIAILKRPSKFQSWYWGERNILLYDIDLTEFSLELAKYFNLEIPQLEVKKK